jgi:hypothetical protein
MVTRRWATPPYSVGWLVMAGSDLEAPCAASPDGFHAATQCPTGRPEDHRRGGTTRIHCATVSKRTIGTALLAVLLAAGAGACSSEGSQAATLDDLGGPVTPAASSPAASSGSPTPAAPSSTVGEPSAADQAAAVAFVKDYFAALTQGLRKGSTKGLQDWYLPGCTICDQNVGDVTAIAQKKQHVEGTELKVLDARYAGQAAAAQLDVGVELQQQPGTLVDAAGKVVQTYTGGPKVRFVLTVTKPDGNAWKVKQIESLGSQ